MRYRTLAFMVAIAVNSAACSGGGSTGGLDVEQNYAIGLSSVSEIPTPKATLATGTADVVVYGERIDWQLAGSNINAITMAHIHNGAVGVAGPVVVTLFAPGAATGAINGIFASGSLTAANLPAGVTLASLKALLLSGNAYVNVHTVANPAGEMRGQLK